LTADDLGLARQTWWSGLRWGDAAAGIVAVGYGIGAAIPAVRQAVTESTLPWQATVVKAVVVIPLATAIPEEFAFRGVLWALLRRKSGQRVATAVSSALFGFWHVLPALAGGAANESVTGVLGGGPRRSSGRFAVWRRAVPSLTAGRSRLWRAHWESVGSRFTTT
jgi:membrane protease YdiL (CAAX protease family)